MEFLGAWLGARGRLARVGWLWRNLVLAVLASLAGLLAGKLLGEGAQALVAALYLWLAATQAVRRLHDAAASGHCLWLLLIPVAGPLCLLWLLLRRGAEGANRYGPDPRPRAAYLQVNTSLPGA